MIRYNSLIPRFMLSIVTVGLLASPTVADDLAQRRKRLETMSPSQIRELRRKQERFDALPEEEQQRIRSLHERIDGHKKSDDLRRLLGRYSEWLKSLPAGQRAELLELPVAERIEKVRSIMQRQESVRFQQFAASYLQNEDRRAIFGWLTTHFVKKHQSTLVELLNEEQRQTFQRLAPNSFDRNRMIMGVIRNMPVDLVDEEDIKNLAERLSETARDKLLADKDPTKQRVLVREFVRAVIYSGRFSVTRAAVPYDELMRFYERELNDSSKDYLNSLPAEQMKRELERWYHFQKSRGRGGRPDFGGRSGRRPKGGYRPPRNNGGKVEDKK